MIWKPYYRPDTPKMRYLSHDDDDDDNDFFIVFIFFAA